MTHHDEPHSPLRSQRRPGVRRREHSQRGRFDGAVRPRLRLVVTPPRVSHGLGMHPALPLTLVFAAFTLTALAVASAIDVASALARTAVTVGTQLRAGFVHVGPVRVGRSAPH